MDNTPMSHQLAVLYAFSCAADMLSNLTLVGSGYHRQAQQTRAGEMCMNSEVICSTSAASEFTRQQSCNEVMQLYLSFTFCALPWEPTPYKSVVAESSMECLQHCKAGHAPKYLTSEDENVLVSM